MQWKSLKQGGMLTDTLAPIDIPEPTKYELSEDGADGRGDFQPQVLVRTQLVA